MANIKCELGVWVKLCDTYFRVKSIDGFREGSSYIDVIVNGTEHTVDYSRAAAGRLRADLDALKCSAGIVAE